MSRWSRRPFSVEELVTAGVVIGVSLLAFFLIRPLQNEVGVSSNDAVTTVTRSPRPTPSPAAMTEVWNGRAPEPATTDPRPDLPSPAAAADRALADLLFPVPAVKASTMRDTFNDARGERRHNAVDIMAPRHSEIVAVTHGAIARIMTSAAGGLAVYQWSEDRRFVYYYAHLQGYAHGLTEGQAVTRGQVLGYVGTTGNAPPNAPHLHFGIARVTEKDRWWGGAPVDPYPIWR